MRTCLVQRLPYLDFSDTGGPLDDVPELATWFYVVRLLFDP